MKKKIRNRLISKYSTTATKFDSKYDGQFICPTCLTSVPKSNTGEITSAHIIPKAAKGTKESLLCKTCNNKFGANQDRWFGEHLKIIENKDNFFSLPQKGRIIINDIEMGGEVRLDKDNSFSIRVYSNRSSPNSIEKFNEISNKSLIKKASISLPILNKTGEIDIGYLTSAYLTMFDKYCLCRTLTHPRSSLLFDLV